MKPLLIYDGDCGFCIKWIEYWKSITKDAVDYAPYQEVHEEYPHIPVEKFRHSVQFIDLSGKVYEGAYAVFKTLAQTPGKSWMLKAYERIPGIQPVTEAIYRLVAKHRTFFSNFTKILWGKSVSSSTYEISFQIFPRILAIIYLIAFLSFWSQAIGLIGSKGILPVQTTLETIRNQIGMERYYWFPTIFWLNQSNFLIHLVCLTGVVLSILFLLGISETFFSFVLWFLYLSIATVSLDFLSFQWDVLLLETGFLTFFLSIKPHSKIIRFLFKWLAFRLMFSSGICKLISGDAAWHSFSALAYHYETQPLPVWTSWYMHQLPVWIHKFSALAMFLVELVLPIFFFAPRRARHFAVLGSIFLQVLIMATGNYGFFNLLSISLCFLLLDDEWMSSVIARRSRSNLTDAGLLRPSGTRNDKFRWKTYLVRSVSVFIFIISLVPFLTRIGWGSMISGPFRSVYSLTTPFNLVNNYGLFAMMTTLRSEIIVEGSQDGVVWSEYEFRYKPGDLKRKPKFVEPHQPRLDWQMWFAALGTYRQNPWFVNFCVRLLQGEKSVFGLIERNPFPESPPKFIRATIYEYHFSDWKTKKQTGQWWNREPQGLYCPVMSIR